MMTDLFSSDQTPDHDAEEEGVVLEVYRIDDDEAGMKEDTESDDTG